VWSAVGNSSLRLVNRNFSRQGDSATNPSAVVAAGLFDAQNNDLLVCTKTGPKRCIQSIAPSVVMMPWCLSGPVATGRYIAAIASARYAPSLHPVFKPEKTKLNLKQGRRLPALFFCLPAVRAIRHSCEAQNPGKPCLEVMRMIVVSSRLHLSPLSCVGEGITTVIPAKAGIQANRTCR